MTERRHRELKQNLKGWQIFFIVISVVIGSGIFSNGGPAIEVAGPGGALLALVIMGIIAICVGECLSEFTQLFPAPNAIVEYIRAFIDEDFGWVIGLAYWFTYSSIFAAQNLAASSLAVYWGVNSKLWQIILFYFLSPGIMVIINLVGVNTFGWIEAIGGILKIMLVIGTTVMLYVMAAEKNNWSNEGPIQDGFVHNKNFAESNLAAICYVIPMLAFGYLGIDTVAVTAFEASSSRSLRFPSQVMAYLTLGLYFLCLLGQCLNVSWTSDHLPLVYGGIADSFTDTKGLHNPASSSLTIIALWTWGKKSLAGFLNGALIFSVLSASNSSLYVASRTLYGMALDVPTTSWAGRALHSFSVVVPQTGVPARALIFSAVAFIWLPFVNLKDGYAVQYLIEIIQISSSVSLLIVWAALSLAYLRYYLWLKQCSAYLTEDYAQFERKSKSYKPFTLLSFLQPLPALTALCGCLAVLAFCSAPWWSTPVTFSKVAIGYAAPIILFVAFVIFKIINRRWWIRTGTDFAVLSQTLDRLKWYKADETDPKEERGEATRVLSPPMQVNGVEDRSDTAITNDATPRLGA